MENQADTNLPPTDLDLNYRSISDLRRIASDLQSNQYHSIKIYLDYLNVGKTLPPTVDDKPSSDKPALEQCSGDNHQEFTFRQDMEDVLVDIITNSFVLNDLTLDFGGMSCPKCLLNDSSFFARIRPISKTLRRLYLRKSEIKTTVCQIDEEKRAYEPLANFLSGQLDLEEIQFQQFNGDDVIVRALGHCINIKIFHLKLVDNFDAWLMSTNIFPKWPVLRSFRMDAAGVHLDRVIDSLKAHCPLLEDLSLPALAHADKTLVLSLMDLLRMRSAQLVQISIRDLAVAEDNFLIFLCEKLPNIRHLDISGGSRFAGVAVKSVVWNKLQYLDITRCNNIGSKFVFAVLEVCHKLTEFRMSATTMREELVIQKISDAGFLKADEWNQGAMWTKKAQD
ncbi:hypothetical protein BC936DRAFT_139978 [Jimgerdemannia flammicorona]|uniref:F-box domain-containing protein n=1 Tax=Jimgerdemannia flammicorona TaxID=994334 RepID=A0A433DHC0_9FUNG|nr:hypothetical protein BC936DRAFT_139978 [Jimgerdemannia flammicorona]